MVPFVRPNIPPISQKDIHVQKAVENELKTKQRQNLKNQRKWGSPNPNSALEHQAFPGYEAD